MILNHIYPFVADQGDLGSFMSLKVPVSIQSILRVVSKMSGNSFRCLVLSDQRAKTQRCSVYFDWKQKTSKSSQLRNCNREKRSLNKSNNKSCRQFFYIKTASNAIAKRGCWYRTILKTPDSLKRHCHVFLILAFCNICGNYRMVNVIKQGFGLMLVK